MYLCEEDGFRVQHAGELDEFRVDLHAFHCTEESLVGNFIKSFFPVQQEEKHILLGAFPKLYDLAKAMDSVGSTPHVAEAVFSKTASIRECVRELQHRVKEPSQTPPSYPSQ